MQTPKMPQGYKDLADSHSSGQSYLLEFRVIHGLGSG